MNAAALFGPVLDAIWQGAVLCVAVELALRIAPKRGAATLAAIWTGVLVACVGAMTLDLIARQSTPVTSSAADPVRQTVSGTEKTAAGTSVNVAVDRKNETASLSAPLTVFDKLSMLAGRVALPVVSLVLFIAAARLSMVAFEIAATFRARRRVSRIEPPLEDLPRTTRGYDFATSSTATTPHVLGFGRPLIVLPSSLLGRGRESLRGVILHELAHVRRYDDVRGAIDAMLAAVLWWNPGVRFALARSASLRERICDDAAVSATHDGLGYATILAEIARGAALPPLAVPCFSTRDTVLERIRAILDRSVDRSPRPDGKIVASIVFAVALLVLGTARMHVPVSAAPPVGRDADSHMNLQIHGTPALPETFRGTWTLGRCNPSRLRLAISFAAGSGAGSESWDDSACFPVAEFRGISESTLASASGDHSFSVVRAAGTFEATGHFAGGSGTGTYTFVPSATFRKRIAALGNGTPTVDQLFALTISDFQSAELDALAAHGYAAPTPDELTRLAYVDAVPAFVLAAVELPSDAKTVSELVKLPESGLRLEEIDEIEGLGYRPSIEQFIRLAQVGVRPDWMAAIQGFGYHPTIEQFIRLAEVGAGPDWIGRLRAAGYTNTNVDDLIERRERGDEIAR